MVKDLLIIKYKSFKMMDYKLVKYCRFCKKKFFASRGESRKYYCDDCQAMINNQRKMEEENER